jgi:hypothetical protein
VVMYQPVFDGDRRNVTGRFVAVHLGEGAHVLPSLLITSMPSLNPTVPTGALTLPLDIPPRYVWDGHMIEPTGYPKSAGATQSLGGLLYAYST